MWAPRSRRRPPLRRSMVAECVDWAPVSRRCRGCMESLSGSAPVQPRRDSTTRTRGARAGAHRLRRPRPPVPTARSWQCARIASCARPCRGAGVGRAAPLPSLRPSRPLGSSESAVTEYDHGLLQDAGLYGLLQDAGYTKSKCEVKLTTRVSLAVINR